MPGTPSQIRQQADDALTTVWAAIQSRQDTYSSSHNGKFWQGLKLFSVTPADGATSAPTIGTATPTDQAGSPWPAAIRTSALPMSIQVDCYDAGSVGTGYVATVEVMINGQTWRRAAQSGPESQRAYPWTRVVEV